MEETLPHGLCVDKGLRPDTFNICLQSFYFILFYFIDSFDKFLGFVFWKAGLEDCSL